MDMWIDSSYITHFNIITTIKENFVFTKKVNSEFVHRIM